MSIKKKGLISVIVPVYNVEKYIEKCINSIINQTYKNLEIIIVNDGSTDRSLEICEKYKKLDNRIVLINKENGGLSDARNAGLEKATGEFVGFVDADDWIADNMYSSLINACTDYSADMAACKMIAVYSEGDEVPINGDEEYICLTQCEAIEAQIENKENIDLNVSVCCKLFNKKLIEDVRFQKGVYYEDIMFSIMILSKITKCVYDTSTLYFYRKNREESITHEWLNEKVFTDWIPALENRICFLREIGYEKIAVIEEFNFLCHLIDVYFSIYESKKKELYDKAQKIGKVLLRNRKIISFVYNKRIGCNHNFYRTYKLKMAVGYWSPKVMFIIFNNVHKTRKKLAIYREDNSFI